jgi:Zn-dependent protease with chaperone function
MAHSLPDLTRRARIPGMDFFDAQDRARRNTALLVVYFVLAVVLMIVALYVAVLLILGFSGDMEGVSWFNPPLLAAVTLITLLIVFSGSAYKTMELRSGGATVASMLGGTRIPPHSTDLAERRLLNVVEEMAIASGVSVPPVYVLKKESSINAFAAGFTPDDAVIGVNQGTLDQLTRDELQGVIAHEFSHLLNGDMRFNVRLIGILHGILLIAIIGYYLLRFSPGRSDRDNKGAGFVVLLGLAAMVIGYIGLFFGRLIKAAVSRQREYLADASAVQFTRNPDGIAGALKKIGGLANQSYVASPEAETASHMFFGSAFPRWANSLFATHPPLADRIRRIDPQFDGRFPRLEDRAAGRRKEKIPVAAAAPASPPVAGMRLDTILPLPQARRLALSPEQLIAAVGAPTSQHIGYSEEFLRRLPEPLVQALREPFSARGVVLAMLLEDSAERRTWQIQEIERREGEGTRRAVAQLAPHVAGLPRFARLPILELLERTLRDLAPNQYASFRKTVLVMIESDRKVSLFELILYHVLLTGLDRAFGQAAATRVRFTSVRAIRPQAMTLLAALARLGTPQAPLAAAAFRRATELLDSTAPAELPPTDEGVAVDRLHHALRDLAASSPAVKRRLLSAATVCVAADGTVAVEEAELLRAVASALDCPIPPIVAGRLDQLKA